MHTVDYERDCTKYRSDQVRSGTSDSIENYKKATDLFTILNIAKFELMNPTFCQIHLQSILLHIKCPFEIILVH